MSMNVPLLLFALTTSFTTQSLSGDQTKLVEKEAPNEETEVPTLRVALTDLSVDGVRPEVAKVINQSLLVEMRKLSRLSVIGMDEIRAMLDFEADKQTLGCDAEESCLAEITDALGADVLVIGSIARVGEQHVFGLRRIDQRSATVVERVSQVFPAGEGEEFLSAVGPAIEKLFPNRPLRAGAQRGVSVEIARRLHPPPLRPWVFWTNSGIASGGLILAGAMGILGVWARAEHQALAEKARAEVVDGARLQTQQALSETAYSIAGALGISAAVATLGAGVVYFFTDWETQE